MGAGGIAIAAGFTASELFAISAVRAAAGGTGPSLESNFALGPWRPPQWSSAKDSASMMYCITVPGPYVSVLGASTADNLVGQTPQDTVGGVATYRQSVTGQLTTTQKPPTYLVFDGVMRASHSQPARPTQFPVQSGANISDHVVLQPARVSLDIIMSDAMQAFATGQWIGDTSKSISCFLVLDALRAARVPLTVSTRLKTYTNMVLVDIIPEETSKTRYGLRARVDFEQIFIATVETSGGTSARSQTTDNTTVGPTNATGVTPGVVTQNMVDGAGLEEANGITVPGAGNWSSNNTGDLSQFLAAPPLVTP